MAASRNASTAMAGIVVAWRSRSKLVLNVGPSSDAYLRSGGSPLNFPNGNILPAIPQSGHPDSRSGIYLPEWLRGRSTRHHAASAAEFEPALGSHRAQVSSSHLLM